jgi:hypothetical protein
MLMVFTAPANAAVFDIADGDSNGLIAAIHAANTNGEPDVINLATNGTYTLRRVVHTGDFFPGEPGDDRNGLPPIVSEITFNGFGATVQRHATSTTPWFRILQVGDAGGPGFGSINDLTIRDGFINGFGGGAVVYAGSTGFSDCVIRDNWVAQCRRGGGVANFASIRMDSTTVTHNGIRQPCSPAGFIEDQGAGVYNDGDLHIANCDFEHAFASMIWNAENGTLQIIGSSFRDVLYSSALRNDGGDLSITDSLITSNSLGLAGCGTASLIRCSVVANSGGIRHDGDLTIESCEISGNDGGDGLDNYSIGAVHCRGNVQISNSRIRNNVYGSPFAIVSRAKQPSARINLPSCHFHELPRLPAAGIGYQAFRDRELLSVVGCEISGNRNYEFLNPFGAGGIYIQQYSTPPYVPILNRVEIRDSVIRDNNSILQGGGVLVEGGVGYLSIDVSIEDSLIANNHATVAGGGIADMGTQSNVPFVPRIALANTTITGNSAGVGGGIYARQSWLRMYNSTVTGNSADSGNGLYVTEAAIDGASTVELANTLIAEQTGDDCLVDAGEIISRGHNLDSDGTCNLDSNGDIAFGFANLGPLADNGGPTLTHALLPGSDVLDAGDPTACAAEPVGGVDQRGYPRPAGAGCDIGAFEAGDYDGDGVIDGVDVCVSPPAAAVNLAGGPLGDIDDDCAVTLVDFQYFEICLLLAGPDTIPLFTECRAVFDFDADQDVDLIDYAKIQAAIASPAE